MAASVTPVELDGLAALQLAAGELEATFVPGAGMICASLRHRGEELLGQRLGLRAYAEQGKTMGIPFLHPFANRVSKEVFEVDGAQVRLDDGAPLVRLEEHGLPIHGLLAGAPWWEIVETRAEGGVAELRAALDFAANDALLARF